MSQGDLANSVIQFTAMQNDVVIFKDFAHGPKTSEFLIGKDSIDAFVAGGGKNICTEADSRLQDWYDGLNKVGQVAANRDKFSPEKQKEFDAALDKLTTQYGEVMSANFNKTGFKNNSQEEIAAYKEDAESIVYAGSKGVKVHAVDSGVSSEKLANGSQDFTKRNQQDGKVADRIADIAETGKTAVIYGAAHSLRGGAGKDRDIEDSLVSKGLEVGRIGVGENINQLGQALSGGTTMHGKFEDFKEAPNTIILMDNNRFLPGSQMQVMQLQTDGKNRELAGELNRDSKEAENSRYKNVTEKDLGNITPPEVFNNAPKAQVVENSR